MREFIMKSKSSRAENTTMIKIDDRLYELLRKFCDKEGRRLRDFVEDSLENAIHTEETIKVLDEKINSLKKKEVKYDYIIAADYLDSSDVDVISVQHEFGIFGGEAGS